MEQIWEGVRAAFGVEAAELNAGHMALRAALIYAATLVLMRLGNKRFAGRSTAFDVVLGFMLGSTLSRAITGNAPLAPTLIAGAVLVGLHWVLAAAAFGSHPLGAALKGHPRRLVRDGEIEWREMRRTHVTRRDLEEAARSKAQVETAEGIEAAWLERSGEISIVPKPPRLREPRVREVEVARGVQRLRIELA